MGNLCHIRIKSFGAASRVFCEVGTASAHHFLRFTVNLSNLDQEKLLGLCLHRPAHCNSSLTHLYAELGIRHEPYIDHVTV